MWLVDLRKLVCHIRGHKDTLRIVSKSTAQLADRCERCGREENRVYMGDLVFALYPREDDSYPFIYMGGNCFQNPVNGQNFFDDPANYKAYREDDERWQRDKRRW